MERPDRGDSRWFAAPAVIGASLVLLALGMRRLGDPDLGWHLATGRAIWTSSSIPTVDTLAFGHGRLRYTAVASDVLLYLAARAGGPLGLQLLGALVAIALGAVVFLHARRGPAGFLAASLVVAGMSSWLAVRPAELSFLLLAATAWLLELHRSAPDARRGRLALAALPPLFFVWANAHGFVALGAALATGYVLYRLAARIARGRAGALLPAEDGTDLRPAAVAVALALAAACVNTAGPRLLLGVYRFDEDFGAIAEWAPTTLHLLLHDEPLALVVAALGLAALFLGRDPRAPSRRVPALYDAAVIVGALAFMSRTTRMIPLAILLVTPVAAARLGWIVPRTRTMVAACSSATIAAGGLMLLAPTTSLGTGFEPSVLPVSATEWVAAARPAGRMWNFWPFGGYLAWTLGPEREVFMDGRNTLAHDLETVTRANRSIADRRAFEQLADELGMEWAITSAPPGDPSAGAGVARSPAWTMTYLDDVAAVYVRRDGPNAGLAAGGYRVLRHDMPPGLVLSLAIGGGEGAAALALDGRRAAEQAPWSKRSNFLSACGAIAAHDHARYAEAVDRLRRLGAEEALLEALEQGRRAAR